MEWQFGLAAFGVLLAWTFQFYDKTSDRKRRRQSTLVAIASEVQAIGFLLRSDRYLERYHSLANQVRNGTWTGDSYVMDIRSNYTRVFEANADSLSELEPEQVSKIVSFYTYTQALIDSSKPDGSAVNSEHLDDVASNVLALEGYLMAILALGDEIVQMPKTPLPTLSEND